MIPMFKDNEIIKDEDYNQNQTILLPYSFDDLGLYRAILHTL